MASLLEHTVMPSGGDYTSLDASIDHLVASHANLVTADVYAEVKIDGTWSSADTAAVTISGLTTDAPRYLLVYAATAARHAGVWSTNKHNLVVGGQDQIIFIGINYVRFDGLQVGSGTPAGSSEDLIFITSSIAANNDIRFSNLILKGHGNASYYQQGIYAYDPDIILYIWNCIIYGIPAISTSAPIRIAEAGTVKIYSTIGIGGENGINRMSGTVTAKNCYFGGSSSADYGGTITKTTCASEDATGSTGLQGIAIDPDTFVNVSAGTEDFHQAADGLSPLKDVGTDTSGDPAPMNFTTDIDGDARDATWDIGADAVVVGGATYNESIIVSSTPACSNSPKVDFFPSLAAFSSTPALNRAVSADLLGSIGLASIPALNRAAIADLLESIGLASAPAASMMGGMNYFNTLTLASTPAAVMAYFLGIFPSLILASNPAASMIGGMDYSAALTLASSPAVSMAYLLSIFPSLVLSSNPVLAASALGNFYNSLTLAGTPAAVMAAVADLFVSLALASDPALAALGGSDFYESLALSSFPAFSIAVFKATFGELTLTSNPALSVSTLADLYAAVIMASAAGISLSALAELFAGLSLSSSPALSALGQIGGEIIQKMVAEILRFLISPRTVIISKTHNPFVLSFKTRLQTEEVLV